MNVRQPTGTAMVRALVERRPAATLPIETDVPCPGNRYGKAQIIRDTLLNMKGDDSFVMKDATQVYLVAKQLGITITTRKDAAGVRVWRVK